MRAVGAPLESIKTPPSLPNEPYIIQTLCGETIYIPCSRSVQRLLVTGSESLDSFALVGTGGAGGAPIGFHFHREAHDVFLCLKGQVNVWAGDQCRTLSEGDFASVPPGTIHQYQILGTHSEFVGLIVPGGWEEFFRFIGEPYDGPLFPLEDNRNVFEVLIPKLKMAAEKFDMVPVPQHPSTEPQPWVDGKDPNLPGELQPYFLRNGSAPRYILGSIVCGVLAGSAESAGRFTIGTIEGSSQHSNSPLSSSFTFEKSHHAVYIAEGSMSLLLDGNQKTDVHQGETAYIPGGHTFSLSVRSRYCKAYVFSNGFSIVSVLAKGGQPFKGSLIPEQAQPWEMSTLEKLQAELEFQIA